MDWRRGCGGHRLHVPTPIPRHQEPLGPLSRALFLFPELSPWRTHSSSCQRWLRTQAGTMCRRLMTRMGTTRPASPSLSPWRVSKRQGLGRPRSVSLNLGNGPPGGHREDGMVLVAGVRGSAREEPSRGGDPAGSGVSEQRQGWGCMLDPIPTTSLKSCIRRGDT